MAEHFNVIGNYRNKAITNDGEIKVYFTHFGETKISENCEICIHFSKDAYNQFYLHENIIGFANYDYEYDINDETEELEKVSDNKIFHIDVFEDIDKFSTFNMILNKESQMSVSIATVENYEEFFSLMNKLYNNAVKNNKNISKNYFNFFHDVETHNYERLGNYFPILEYMLFTFE